MLRELRINNFAVIEQVALELGPGLNVLTGETGAGKSIILNALGLISGARGSSDMIRHNEEEASVEALFEDLPSLAQESLREAGYDVDDELVIKRVLSRSGKNRIYVNGSLCPLGLLAEVGSLAVHIYGQHEHQSLLAPEAHMALLDGFGQFQRQLDEMKQRFETLTSAWNALCEAREVFEKRRREKSLLESQADEISRARLQPEEEEELQARKNILMHAEKLHQGCLEGEELLYEGEESLVSRLGKYTIKLRDLARIDEGLSSALQLLESAQAQLQEATAELRRYSKRSHFEPGALDQLENRLAEIQRLKRKYKGTVDDILRIHVEVEQELAAFTRGEEELPALQNRFEEAYRSAWEIAEKLSHERQRLAKRFKRELEKELKDLGMPETIFEVRFPGEEQKSDDPPFLVGDRRLTSRGMDRVEFYFSPNPGEPPKPLAKIASGGELSRLMLAIKAMILTPGEIPTLLFDEVDAGIGGRVAEIVGKKLKQVAASHQVICVTHLPQIAALADSHHVVQKEITNGRTATRVKRLGKNERIEEVARMLGGVRITDRTRRHAEEMVKGE